MKTLKSFISCFILLLLGVLLVGCGNNTTTEATPTISPELTGGERSYDIELNILDDNYRNYYEIFVWSFCDSDNNGIGDFNGITSKLDYIKDMGFNGIWLMPINKATSYHKYDVEDYYSVDPQFGTMTDFTNLLTEAHKRGINVIIDLVLNHTSINCTWFRQAVQYIKENGTPGGEYGDYYNFTNQAAGNTYAQITGTQYYYECPFWSGMPDLNLDSENVKREIKNVIEYWLDMGVDGYRLDAVTSYYTNNIDKNVEFLSWVNETVKAKDPDAYIVGEAWYSAHSLVRRYYESGCDSFFTFPLSGGEGGLAKALNDSRTNNGVEFGNLLTTLDTTYDTGILAPFLSNHDMNRIANFVGRSKPEKIKMINGLLSLLKGSPFVYYGEEIGMITTNTSSDPFRRIAILWNKDKTDGYCKRVPDGASVTTESYVYPSVAEQQQDPNSILNYYKYCNYLRNTNPEIARGVTSIKDYSSQSEYVTVFTRTYNNKTITIVVNLNSTETINIELNKESLGYSGLSQYLCTNSDYRVLYNAESNTVTLPPYSIAIFR